MDGATGSTAGAGATGARQRDGAGAQLSAAKDEVKQEAKSVAQELKGTVKETKEELQHKAADTVNRQKHMLADRLEAVVHALDAAGRSLRDDQQTQLANYVDELTEQMNRSTGYLRNNDTGGMFRDMERLARENTPVFLGGSFVAGAALGRFLRASEPAEDASRSGSFGMAASSSEEGATMLKDEPAQDRGSVSGSSEVGGWS